MYSALRFAVHCHGDSPHLGRSVSASAVQPPPPPPVTPPINGIDDAMFVVSSPPTYRRATYGRDADS